MKEFWVDDNNFLNIFEIEYELSNTESQDDAIMKRIEAELAEEASLIVQELLDDEDYLIMNDAWNEVEDSDEGYETDYDPQPKETPNVDDDSNVMDHLNQRDDNNEGSEHNEQPEPKATEEDGKAKYFQEGAGMEDDNGKSDELDKGPPTKKAKKINQGNGVSNGAYKKERKEKSTKKTEEKKTLKGKAQVNFNHKYKFQ